MGRLQVEVDDDRETEQQQQILRAEVVGRQAKHAQGGEGWQDGERCRRHHLDVVGEDQQEAESCQMPTQAEASEEGRHAAEHSMRLLSEVSELPCIGEGDSAERGEEAG